MLKKVMTALICLLLLALSATTLVYFVNSKYYSGMKFSEEDRKVKIYLHGQKVVGDRSDSLQIDGCKIKIHQAGSYQFEGNLEDGQIIVEVPKDQEVKLVLNSVDITCIDSAPILIKSAKKVKIKLKDKAVNRLSDGLEYGEVADGEIQPKACIYSKANLVINGEGSLVVEGNYKHGIYTTGRLKIKDGTLQVTAPKKAIGAKDSIRILGGDIQVQSQRDGIYSKKKVRIEGGKILIQARNYGIFGRQAVQIEKEADLTIKGALAAISSMGQLADTEGITIEP